MDDKLDWNDSFAIAKALQRLHPSAKLAEVSLQDIYCWTLALPDFHDVPHLSTDAILMAIFTEWFEEVNPI